MKNILDTFTFTLKSIKYVAIAIFTVIGTICLTNGFENDIRRIVSIILISCLLLALIVYIIIVLYSYYKLPQNRNKTDIGVLFFINTHGKTYDYNSIIEKFCEKFDELSSNIENNNLKPIILSQKQVSVIKNINDRDIQNNLLERTNCKFGIFIKSTDVGKDSDEYQLQMNAMFIHEYLKNEYLEKLLQDNFSYIFKGLHISTLNKRDDLKDLQNLSTQLYYICQLIYAASNEYVGNFEKAMNICNGILKNVQKDTSKFYEKLIIILKVEICCCVINIANEQYNDFIYKDSYNVLLLQNALSLMQNAIQNLNINQLIIDYHSIKAIYKLFCGNLMESKGEIQWLENKFKKISPNLKSWLYSEAFLIACENNPKNYYLIDQKYKKLKYNTTQNPVTIYDFMNAYLNRNPNNLGLKIAMIMLIKYKDLNSELLPSSFRESVVNELISIKQNDLAQYIEQINKEILDG